MGLLGQRSITRAGIFGAIPMNSMKDTRCKICDQDLNNMKFDDMMAHVNRHAAANKDQKSMEEF